MGKTKISWTDQVWNPTTGCSHVSAGCEHCYAETLSLRRGWSKKPWTAAHAAENVVLHPDRLEQPLHWRKPRMVFVNSMSDLFHEKIPDDFIDRVFAVMALCWHSSPWDVTHQFQVLTKRPDRTRQWFNAAVGLETREEEVSRVAAHIGRVVWDSRGRDHWRYPSLRCLADIDNRRRWPGWPLPNVWLGVSVEDQRRAEERIPVLLDTPAAVRWISVEPLLGPVDLDPWWVAKSTVDLAAVVYGGQVRHPNPKPTLDWCVVGGESGAGHRPMKIEWLESIVEQCQTANVPVFVKQASAPLPGQQGEIPDDLWALKEFPAVATCER